MKKIIEIFKGDKGEFSSKRFVGIVGAFVLFGTMVNREIPSVTAAYVATNPGVPVNARQPQVFRVLRVGAVGRRQLCCLTGGGRNPASMLRQHLRLALCRWPPRLSYPDRSFARAVGIQNSPDAAEDLDAVCSGVGVRVNGDGVEVASIPDAGPK